VFSNSDSYLSGVRLLALDLEPGAPWAEHVVGDEADRQLVVHVRLSQS